MAEVVNMVAGDSLPALAFVFCDKSQGDPGQPATWPAIDLTGATLTAALVDRTGVIAEQALTVTVTDAVAGEGYISWGSTLSAAGNYTVELTADFGGSKMTAYDTIGVRVRARVSA